MTQLMGILGASELVRATLAMSAVLALLHAWVHIARHRKVERAAKATLERMARFQKEHGLTK